MKIRKLITGIGIFLLCLLMLAPEQAEAAASSYTDAKLFFETVNNENHIDYTGYSIYFGTKSKAAKNNSVKRWWCIGWEITMSGGGRSVTVVVKRDGKYLTNIGGEQISSDGHKYNLYKIDYQALCEMMQRRDPSSWDVTT